jgi:hypothetical protein
VTRTTAERHEEIAINYKDGTVWIAYRYSGGKKDESVYVAGWDMEGKKGGELYSTLRRVLEVQFGRNDDSGALDTMFAPFLSCDQAHLARKIPVAIRSIFEEFFASNDIPVTINAAPLLSWKQANRRWASALGDPLQEDGDHDHGYRLALSVLQNGVASGQ